MEGRWKWWQRHKEARFPSAVGHGDETQARPTEKQGKLVMSAILDGQGQPSGKDDPEGPLL